MIVLPNRDLNSGELSVTTMNSYTDQKETYDDVNHAEQKSPDLTRGGFREESKIFDDKKASIVVNEESTFDSLFVGAHHKFIQLDNERVHLDIHSRVIVHDQELFERLFRDNVGKIDSSSSIIIHDENLFDSIFNF